MLVPRAQACQTPNSTTPFSPASMAATDAAAAALQASITQAQQNVNSILVRSPWDFREFGMNTMKDVLLSNREYQQPGVVPFGQPIPSAFQSPVNVVPAGGGNVVRGPVNQGWWSGMPPGFYSGEQGGGPGGASIADGASDPNAMVPLPGGGPMVPRHLLIPGGGRRAGRGSRVRGGSPGSVPGGPGQQWPNGAPADGSSVAGSPPGAPAGNSWGQDSTNAPGGPVGPGNRESMKGSGIPNNSGGTGSTEGSAPGFIGQGEDCGDQTAPEIAVMSDYMTSDGSAVPMVIDKESGEPMILPPPPAGMGAIARRRGVGDAISVTASDSCGQVGQPSGSTSQDQSQGAADIPWWLWLVGAGLVIWLATEGADDSAKAPRKKKAA